MKGRKDLDSKGGTDQKKKPNGTFIRTQEKLKKVRREKKKLRNI